MNSSPTGSQASLPGAHQTYKVSKNVFNIVGAVPLIMIAIFGTDGAIYLGANAVAVGAACAVMIWGVMLIGPVALRGELTLDTDGITFQTRGKCITAAWSQVSLADASSTKPYLRLQRANQPGRAVRLPGGCTSEGDEFTIPLNMFGHRSFDVSDALNAAIDSRALPSLVRSPIPAAIAA